MVCLPVHCVLRYLECSTFSRSFQFLQGTPKLQTEDMSMYRLCGFSGILSLRPTAFQEPLPPSRICDLCGVVPERTLLLPCGHFLCQLCLDGIVSKGSVCLLDGEEFLEQNITRLEFMAERIAKCKVSSFIRLMRSIEHRLQPLR